MTDILEALNHLNLTQWFIDNDPPESYSFWEVPEIDMILEYIETRYSCIEFSIKCVEAKNYLKLRTESC